MEGVYWKVVFEGEGVMYIDTWGKSFLGIGIVGIKVLR